MTAGLRTSPTRPPGPKGHFLSGHLQDFEQDRLGFLMRSREAYGDLVAIDTRTTIVHDPALARSVLRNDSFVVNENFLQQRLTATQQDESAALRRLFTPLLRRSRVGLAMRLTNVAVSGAITALAVAGLPVDPLQILDSVTSSTIADFYFGVDGASTYAPTLEFLDALSEVIGNPFAGPTWLPTAARRRIRSSHLRLRSLVVDLMKHRRAPTAEPRDVATGLVRNAAEASHHDLEPLADLLIGSMLASHRVPAAQAAWVLMALAERPELQERLADEARRFAGSPQEVNSAESYPLTHALVLETMRLHPATWLIRRVCAHDTILDGYRLPRGHNIWISPYVLGRDPALYADPDQFNLDRWLHPDIGPDLGSGIQPVEHLPFGAGERRCPGSHLATGMLIATTLRTIAELSITRAEGTVVPDARIHLAPTGLRLRFDTRTPNPSTPGCVSTVRR